MNTHRYLLAILLSVTPLLLLTAVTAIRGFSSQSIGNSAMNAATLDIELEATRTLEYDAAIDQKELMALASQAGRPMQSPSSTNTLSSERLTDLQAEWQSVGQMRDLVRKLLLQLDQVRDLQDIADSTVDQVTQSLQTLRSQAASSTVPGSEKLQQVIDEQLGLIEGEKQRRTELAHNQQVLNRAQSAFSEERFDECIAELTNWQGSITAEAETLRSVARFTKDAIEIEETLAMLEKSEPGDSWLPLLESVRRFLGTPPLNAPELKLSARYKNIQERLLVLDARYHLGVLSVPGELPIWSRKVRQSLDVYSTPQQRRKILSLLTTWFAANLPEKHSDGQDMQMAVDGNGNLLEGYFESQEDNRWYKFFAGQTKESSRRDLNAWGAKMAKSLQQQPTTIPTSKVVSEYSTARQKLLADPFGIMRWNELSKQLRACQLAIDHYKQLGGTVSLSFDREIAFCQQVVDGWQELEPLLRENTVE